jgi:hypothetical protein
MKPKAIFLLTILVAAFCLGCQGGDDKKGQPVQPGDYAGEPGGAQKSKTGG